MTFERKTHSAQLVPVQLNIRVPFAYRDFLTREARRQGISVNQLIRDTLAKQLPHPSIAMDPEELKGRIE